jgi:hypothetical protein
MRSTFPGAPPALTKNSHWKFDGEFTSMNGSSQRTMKHCSAPCFAMLGDVKSTVVDKEAKLLSVYVLTQMEQL